MIPLPQFADKTVVVLGLARSGLAAARALTAAGARVLAWDDVAARREEAQANGIVCTEPTTYDWSSIAALLMSPGIPTRYPQPHPFVVAATAHHVPLVSDIDLLLQAKPECRFIGITGTNGKSTTTALVIHLLRQAGFSCDVGGNFGPAALGLSDLPAGGLYVLEVSSYQLDLVPHARFDCAVLLNITPDHLDRHGGMAGYVAAKRNIFKDQPKTGIAIIGCDDDDCRAIADDLAERAPALCRVSVATELPGGLWVDEATLIDDQSGAAAPVVDLSALPRLPGRHNAQNIAAAYAVLRWLGVSLETITQGLQSFPGLAHRQELVGELEGIRFINDSKATNAEATEKALLSHKNIYWIAGGVAKDGGINALKKYFPAIRGAFLIGRAAETFAATIGTDISVTQSGDLSKAVQASLAAIRKNGECDATVLLSPACASQDQFRDYEERGDLFRSLVSSIPGVQVR